MRLIDYYINLTYPCKKEARLSLFLLYCRSVFIGFDTFFTFKKYNQEQRGKSYGDRKQG